MTVLMYREDRKRSGWYLCFTPDTNPEEAKKKYREYFKTEPAEVFTYQQMLWLGPVEHYKNGEKLEPGIPPTRERTRMKKNLHSS